MVDIDKPRGIFYRQNIWLQLYVYLTSRCESLFLASNLVLESKSYIIQFVRNCIGRPYITAITIGTQQTTI